MEYQYFIGILLIGFIFVLCLLVRPDLRRLMLWGGWYYFLMQAVTIVIIKSLGAFTNIATAFNPAYWHPQVLFGLDKITGGWSLEDGLFVFLMAGIATFLYEFAFRKQVKHRYTKKHSILAIVVSLVAFPLLLFVTPNPIYPLIMSSFLGALVIWVKRKDLVKHSLWGGLLFLACYFFIFLIINKMIPDFVNNWNLGRISGVLFWGIPIEELLWALSFGLFWAPIYEYEHGVRV